jgi:serine/threonine protein kinase/WD40 repeat protein
MMRDPLIGTRINRYEISESIHKSDVLGIYKAYDTKLERFVLIKTILHSGDYTKEAVDYFLAESKTLAKLAHPNIAKVLDFGFENGNLYLVSEYVPGTSLSDLMNQPMAWQNAINILLPLTNALVYAHSRGIIHRDLKPDNIIINTDDQPILSDFSLMRIIEEEETRDMTGTNVGLGSPAYISPEQGQGLTVDFRSDIYSLGVIFFEMVTGKKLFYATSSMEIVIQQIMADPPKPRTLVPTLPRMVENVILNALSKDREKRYQSMEEFSNAMQAVIDADNREKNKTTRRPSRLVIFSGIGITLLLLVIGFIFFRNRAATTISTTMTPQTAETKIETPRLTPTAEPISAASASSTLTTPLPNSTDPFANYSLPALPVLAGTQLPISNQVIDANNINALKELARWGQPDLKQLALINNDQVLLAATSAGIYFLDPKTLGVRKFFDTTSALTTFTVSDDDTQVATADESGTIAIWNIADGTQLYKLNNINYKPKPILSLDFSPDNSKLVFSDNDSHIHFWNIKQNQYYSLEGRLAANANKVMFLDAGNTVLSGGDEHQIMIWDVPSGKLKEQYPTAQKIIDMSFSPDNQYLAVAMTEATLEIWDFNNKKAINKITIPNSRTAFTFIRFLSNGSNFITGSDDGFIRSWNIAGSKPNWESTSAPQTDHPTIINAVKAIAIFSNGSKLVTEFADGLMEAWDLTAASPKSEATQIFGSVPIKRAVISPDDKILAYQGNNSFVKILSIGNDTESIPISGTLPRGNPISPNSKMIGIVQTDNSKTILDLYTLSADMALPSFKIESLFKFYDFPVTVAVNGAVNGSISYSTNSNMLTVFENGIMKYWSTSSGLELKKNLIKTESGCPAIYRKGSRNDGTDDILIVAGTENGVIYSDKNLKYFCHVPRNPRTLSEKFMPDGSIIVLALQNQLIEVWNVNNNVTNHQIKIETPGDVWDATISNDSKLLATASDGGVIEIYTIEDLSQPIKTLNILTGPIYQVLFSNNGKYLIAGLADGTLRFYGINP